MVNAVFEKLLLAIAIVSSLIGIYAWATDKNGKRIYRWIFIILSILLFTVYFILTGSDPKKTDPLKPESDTLKNQSTPVKDVENETTTPAHPQINTPHEEAVKIVPAQKPTEDLLVIGSNNYSPDILQDIQTVFERKGSLARVSGEEFTAVADYKGIFKKLVLVHFQINNAIPTTSLRQDMMSVNYSYSVKYYNVETGQLIAEKSKKNVAKAGFQKEAIIEEIKKDIIEETTSML